MDASNVARFLSAPTAFLISGYSFAASQNSLPLLYDKPASVATPIFTGVFYRGATVAIPGALISAGASSFLAYRFPEQRRLFASAAGLCLGWLAWTSLVMSKGILRLIEISQDVVKQQKADQTGEAVELLKAWAIQNGVRAAMALAAGAISWWASRQTETHAKEA